MRRRRLQFLWINREPGSTWYATVLPGRSDRVQTGGGEGFRNGHSRHKYGAAVLRSLHCRHGETHKKHFCRRPGRSVPTFGARTGRFSIGITSRETGVTYHLHPTEAEAQQFAAFVAERVELTAHPSMR
jgi:hypothetical protein